MNLFIPLFYVLGLFQSFDWVSFDMIKRTNQNGKTSKNVAKVYFNADGKMLTHFISPMEVMILNNKDGELQLYNPNENTVFQQLNHMLGTENTNVYYFLNQETDDMGLAKIGFSLASSKLDNNLLISIWKAPKQMQQQIHDVELVHQLKKPVFMGYRDTKGKYLKKVYFYQYEQVSGVDFPMSITEIDFVKKDSIVSKTVFESFKINQAEDQEWVNFMVPTNATLIK